MKISTEKAFELGKIAAIKSDIYYLEWKMGIAYKNLGEKIYRKLKQEHEIEEILKEIQPALTEIEKIEERITDKLNQIEEIKEEASISKQELAALEEYLKNGKNSKYKGNSPLED
jgi:peptidoglycan hydrolase CwlO-like protein